jgi:hypothetical protein
MNNEKIDRMQQALYSEEPMAGVSRPMQSSPIPPFGGKSGGGKGGSSKWANQLDKDGDGTFDLDDVLIMGREVIQWVFSWRGAMVLSGAFTVFSASINIVSWNRAMGNVFAGFISWGIVQTIELLPSLDDLNPKASLMAMIRLQRKPLDVPSLNEAIVPAAKRRFERYRNIERNQDALFETIRMVAYVVELFTLVVGGGLLTASGLSWGALLLAIIGIFGVEIGLRMFNYCGDRILTNEERDYFRELMAGVTRQTTRLK